MADFFNSQRKTLPTIRETAYPCFKTSTNASDLADIYTPNAEELVYAESFIRTGELKLCFLTMLKSFQRLGYFVPICSVPVAISKYIAGVIGCTYAPDILEEYDLGRNKWYHLRRIRQYFNVKPVGKETIKLLGDTMRKAALTKQDLVDVINVGIEELVRNRFELPAFDTFLREARKARAQTNARIYRDVYDRAGEQAKIAVEDLLKADPATKRSPWNRLRQEPGKPTLKELRELIGRLSWLREIDQFDDPFRNIPYAKVRHLALEANSLDVARMRVVSKPKRFALAAALIKFTLASVVDDLCDILVRKMNRIHNKGREKLAEYLENSRGITDEIIANYKEIHDLISASEPPEKQLLNIKTIFDSNSSLVEYSRQHAIFGSKNYFRFLWSPFKGYRSEFIRILENIRLISTSSDKSLEEAIAFALAYKDLRARHIPFDGKSSIPDLSWIPDAWWYLVTGQRRRRPYPVQINRQQFEVCLFSQIVQELKSADLCAEGSEKYADFRDQLISWEEFREKLPRYAEITGIPMGEGAFISHVRAMPQEEAEKLNRSYPENMEFRILENGELSLKKLKAKSKPEPYGDITGLISDRMPLRSILDVLADTQKLLDWCGAFGPISGLQTKLRDPVNAYIITAFCYGCNLGPTQTWRSLPILDRKQIAWVNQRHITEESLQKATEIIINAYNKFALPGYWGDTSSVSADGMKWDIYENNLLSEYHIRHGGYGGIGYYHVSDNYIALFSRFIPCGVYEAIYILDPFFQNKSDIRPDTIHADTHGQSLTVFGLAFLLAIQLMPRIARWKNLHIFKPFSKQYQNIEPVFSKEEIDWGLISRHLADMLRVVISIQEGRIAPSVILRRLGTHSRKNKLYFAFQELGKAVRSAYLLHYLREPELRRKVNHATTVSEAFNNFIQFVSFGNKGIIAENTRDQQRKIIKYGHLAANALIFMNVYDQSKIMNDLVLEGHVIAPEIAGLLSPYRTGHFNRFGAYHLDETRSCPAIDYTMEVVSHALRQ